MPHATDPEDPDFDEASSKLDEGLRSCRAVLSGYRALLSQDADNDDGIEEDSASASTD